jgi:hypothetical protein
MSKRSNFNCLEVGDKVQIKGVSNPTIWEITAKGPRFQVWIREVHPTIKYAAQRFDASLLKLVPDAKRTAASLNASGVFKPFTVIG